MKVHGRNAGAGSDGSTYRVGDSEDDVCLVHGREEVSGEEWPWTNQAREFARTRKRVTWREKL